MASIVSVKSQCVFPFEVHGNVLKVLSMVLKSPQQAKNS